MRCIRDSFQHFHVGDMFIKKGTDTNTKTKEDMTGMTGSFDPKGLLRKLQLILSNVDFSNKELLVADDEDMLDKLEGVAEQLDVVSSTVVPAASSTSTSPSVAIAPAVTPHSKLKAPPPPSSTEQQQQQTTTTPALNHHHHHLLLLLLFLLTLKSLHLLTEGLLILLMIGMLQKKYYRSTLIK